MNELTVAERWIHERLTADVSLMALATGGVHANLAPANTAPPYVVFSMQDGKPLTMVGGYTVWLQATYQVKAIVAGNDLLTGGPIAERIRVALHLASGATTGGIIIVAEQKSVVQYLEDDAGALWLHIGGLYEIAAQRA